MPNIAILIDAENVLPIFAEQLMQRASSLGDLVRKEIYGAPAALTAWVEPVLRYAIHPNLTIKASKGKNSSDIALVIGAMDMLMTEHIDTMVIASSDSDFSALSVRLRSAGIEVIGMGTETANPLWRTSCTSFVTLEQPQRTASQPRTPAPKPQQQEAQSKQPQPKETKPQPDQQAQSSTHASRLAVIRAAIHSVLEESQGRVSTTTMFAKLNNIPEYKVDQRGSQRKPLNYVTRQFSDILKLEETPEGSFFSAVGKADSPKQLEPKPATEPAPEKEEETVQPAQPELPKPQAEEPESLSDEVNALLKAGIPLEAAQRITELMADSKTQRQAYNKLRSAFGNKDGTAYYNTIKGLAQA